MKSIFTLTLVIIALSISAQTILEVHHGQQPYPTIQSAINEALSLTGSVTILVYDSIYEENLIIQNCTLDELIIESINGPDNCIIDGSFNGSVIEINNSNYVTIDGFTLQNGTGNELEESTSGGGILLSSSHAIIIQNCIITDNICTGSGGGGGILCYFSSANINNTVFKNNTVGGSGGGISILPGDVTNQCDIIINDCILFNNSSGSRGGGLHALYNAVLQQANLTLTITKSIFFDNSAAFYGGGLNIYSNSSYTPTSEYIILKGNTICDNSTSTTYGYGGICMNNINSPHFPALIENCILWGNANGQIPNDNHNHINYCDIQGGYAGTGNIDDDPLFTDPGSGFYYLQWNEEHISPCIDSGDPTIIDPDETPSDMGAFRAVDHDFHLTTAEHDRYRYRSFPVIDIDYVQQGDETTYICAPVEEQTEYFKIFYQDGNEKVWDGEIWDPDGDLEFLDSVEGYKIRTTSDVEIPTSGITLPEDTRVYLDEGKNWVGYFIGESMTLQDAFAEIWDHLTAVYSEDWAWESPGIPHTRSTLLYGKMYIVHVDEACDFVYGNGTPVDPKEREMTEGFYYVETPEYSPINIESLDDPTVLEVGVFLDGECIGATQVEEFPLQILAFPAETPRGSGDITFEFYCGGRSYKPAQDYKVLNKETGRYVNSKIELRPYEFTTICFGNPVTPEKFTLSGNYPNPFNPTTTISYSIPTDGNVELIVYNLRGQKVKTLISGTQPIGVYNVTWNGKDENDRSVSSGVYLYKLNSSGKTAVKKMLLLK